MKWDRSFFRPRHETAKQIETDVDAEIWVYQMPHGPGQIMHFHVMCFFGKQAKPVANYYYRTEEARTEAINRWIDGRRATHKARAERRADCAAPCTLQVGDILNTCWGYDQTNREFYQVLSVKGRRVTVHEIEQRTTKATSHDSWMTEGVKDAFRKDAKPTSHVVTYGSVVKISSCQRATPWDGKPCHASNGH